MKKTWTPFAVQRVATENGWDAKEYDSCGARFLFTRWSEDNQKHSGATVHVAYRPDGGMLSAWLHIRNCDQSAWSGGDWYMLDNKATGKRDIVIRWLAGDFAAGGFALQ